MRKVPVCAIVCIISATSSFDSNIPVMILNVFMDAYSYSRFLMNVEERTVCLLIRKYIQQYNKACWN